MTNEQIKQRIAALETKRVRAQADADMQLAYQFGLIDGQIAVLQTLLSSAEPMPGGDADANEAKAESAEAESAPNGKKPARVGGG